MPEFIMETDGHVVAWNGHPITAWENLDDFTQGYLEACFFTSCDPSAAMTEIEPDHEFQDGSIPADAGFSDIHPDSLTHVVDDCAKFQRDHADQLAIVYGLEPGRYSRDGSTIDARRAGMFFWYACNGHGIAWDDDFAGDESGARTLQELQDACRALPSRDATWGEAADGCESSTGYGFVFVE